MESYKDPRNYTRQGPALVYEFDGWRLEAYDLEAGADGSWEGASLRSRIEGIPIGTSHERLGLRGKFTIRYAKGHTSADDACLVEWEDGEQMLMPTGFFWDVALDWAFDHYGLNYQGGKEEE